MKIWIRGLFLFLLSVEASASIESSIFSNKNDRCLDVAKQAEYAAVANSIELGKDPTLKQALKNFRIALREAKTPKKLITHYLAITRTVFDVIYQNNIKDKNKAHDLALNLCREKSIQ